MKIIIKRKPNTALANCPCVLETVAPLIAANIDVTNKPVRETTGRYWHLAANIRHDGVIRAYCGAYIRLPFLNDHPGPDRCTFCYMSGYPGDGVTGKAEQ